MRTCPRCKTGLVAVDYEGVAVDACARCGGEWLDAGELKQIVDAREREWAAQDLEAMKKATIKGVPLYQVREKLPCPVCGQAMETFNYGGDSGIVLDRCRACGGVWLDGGELEKVQVLVEASDLALRDDVKRYAARLRSLVTREEARAVRDARQSRAPSASALVYRIMDI